jgi:hypothetical protein
MPTSSYINDLISPFWVSLTDGQRSAWHFFAEDNPIINHLGDLTTVNGWQIFVHVNSWLSIAQLGLMLADPPDDLDPPAPINLQCQLWKAKLLDAAGDTYRAGRVFLNVAPAFPSNRVGFVMRNSTYESPWSLHPWPPAHLSVIAPSASGLHDLSVRSGYNTTWPGSQYEDRMKIIGPWARAHPGERIGRLIVASTENGAFSVGSIMGSG